MNTLNTLLMFTNLGNYLYVPVYELPELKWKELGKHISNVIKIEAEETIIESVPVFDFEKEEYITIFTKDGMIKRTKLSEFKVQRYSKPISCMKIKSDDKVVSVISSLGDEIFITTKNGYGLRYKVDEVAPIGLRASGVKAITLKNDEVKCGHVFTNAEHLSIITDKGTGKRIKLSEFEPMSRARKGILMVRDVKTNPYSIIRTFIIPAKSVISLKLGIDFKDIKLTELPITDRYSTGTMLTKTNIDDVLLKREVVKETDLIQNNISEDKEVIQKPVDLNKIDEKILTIDDFLDDFKLKD
jgi:topoisomerase-4 subunit A